MEGITQIEDIQDLLIEIRGERVLLDSDVAKIYGLEIRDVKKAVKRNRAKFPDGYIIQISKDELDNLQWKFSTSKISKIRGMPKAFTERGLYMLATILKGKQYAQKNLSIIDTFYKIKRDLSSYENIICGYR